MKTEIDQLLDWKPLGQRIMDEEYHIITKDDINKKLRILEKAQKSFDNYSKKLQSEGIKTSIPPYKGNFKWIIRTNKNRYEYEIILYAQNLEYYLIHLPEKILNVVRKAKSIGLNEFKIYWLESKLDKTELKDNDPIITAQFGSREIFITQFNFSKE